MFAVGTLTTSCFNLDNPINISDDPVINSKVKNISGEKFAILATSNLNATFSVDVAGVDAQTNVTSATFKNLTANTVKITVKYTGADAADYVNASQTVTVNFSDKTTSAALRFVFVKKSFTSVSQATAHADGANLTNDDRSVATAIMHIESGTDVSNAKQGDFSITVSANVSDKKEAGEISVNSMLPAVVYSLFCEPEGAILNQKVFITLDFGTMLAGETVSLVSGSQTVNTVVGTDGKATFEISQFDLWDVVFSAKAEAIESASETIATMKIDAVKCVNNFSYLKNVGIENDLNGYLALYAKNLFGELKTQIEETGSFETDGTGTATITVIQNKKIYTLSYGSVNFKVTVWGNVRYKVEFNGEVTTEGYSGGSGI